MMFAFFATALLAAVVAQSAIAEGDKPVPERAADVFASIGAGHIDRTLLTPGFSALFTDATLANDASIIATRGEPKSMTLTARNDSGSAVRYVFLVVWKDRNAVSFTLGIDKATNRIDALYLLPAQVTGS
jgi:hypothetical protein